MRVAVIGAGGIGRRHAQSLAGSKDVTALDIIDPQRKALKQTAALIQEHAAIPVNYYREINSRATYDVAIIATGANERYSAIEAVKKKAKYLILEKFLFNHIKEYAIEMSDNVVYVNCPRRAMECYDRFIGQKPTLFYYGMQGLLSNTVHFADLLSYWTGSEVVRYDIDIGKPKRTKRSGYYDCNGRIVITAGNGMAYLNTATMKKNQKTVTLIVNDHLIDEDERTITKPNGKVKPFSFKYQSEMTSSYLKDISKTGECRLARYEDSMQWHMSLLDGLRRAGWVKNIT